MQPEFHGIVPVDSSDELAGVQRLAVRWPPRLKQAAAFCNSLNVIAKHQVAADIADKQAFKAVEARFHVPLCNWSCKAGSRGVVMLSM